MNGANGNADSYATEQTPLLATAPILDPIVGDAEFQRQVPLEARRSVSGMRGLSIILSMGTLIFLQTSNISLLTTIQSAIADDLQAYAEVSWFTSAYLIPMASVPALCGRLCQLFRPQSFMLVSSLVLVVGLIITASAPNYWVFLVGRALTGFGAAGNFPVSIIVIIELTSLKRRGLFMGLLGSAFTVGLALGAVIAGALEPIVGWRTVFWLQIPFAFLAGVAVCFAMPTAPSANDASLRRPSTIQKLGSIDYAGAFTLILTVGLLLFGLSSHTIQVTPIILSMFMMATFITIESSFASTPIIPISVLRSRGTVLTCFATLAMMMSRYLVILYTPVYFIAARSWSQAGAGSTLIAVNGGFATGGLLVGWIHIRRAGSFYIATLMTFVAFVITLYMLSAISSSTTSVPLYTIIVFFNGFSTGASLNYTLVHLLHLIPASDHFIATSVVAMFRGFGGSFGSAIGGGIFSRVLRETLERGFEGMGIADKEELVRKLLGSPRLVASLEGEQKAVAVDGYVAAIKALFFAGACLALVGTIVQAGTGWEGPLARKVRARDGEDRDEGREER